MPKAHDLEDLLSLLSVVESGQLTGRQAWTFGPDGGFHERTEAQIFVESSLRMAGFFILPANFLHFAARSDMLDQMKEADRVFGKFNRPE